MQPRPKVSFLALVLIIIGVLIPFVWVTILKNYAVIDVGVFRAWSACLQEQGVMIYRDCEIRPNYPTVGIFLSGGILAVLQDFLHITDVNLADQGLRYVLAGFESINFLLLILIFRWSQFRYPIATALAIILLPSTWAGAAVWGQIDHVSLCFLLVAIAAILKYWLTLDQFGSQSLAQSWIYYLVISLGISLYILNKQIALFSFPFLIALLGITLYKINHKRSTSTIGQSIVLLLVLSLSFRVLDSLLWVEPSYLGSSFIAVWAQGSGHGNMISGDGANLWVLIQREMQSTSHFSFFDLGWGAWQYTVKPYILGIVVYGLTLIFLFQSVWKATRNQITIAKLDNSSDAIALLYLCCLFHGVSWLGFNVILTGSHDRHPYIAYISLLLCVAYYGLEKRMWSWQLINVSGFVATAYGLFIVPKR